MFGKVHRGHEHVLPEAGLRPKVREKWSNECVKISVRSNKVA